MKLTWVAAAWLVGLGIGSRWYGADPLIPLVLSLLALCAWSILRLAGIRAAPIFLLAVCLLGLWRFEVSQPVSTPPPVKDTSAFSLRGTVTSDPEVAGSRIKFTVKPVGPAEWRLSGGPIVWTDNGDVLVFAHPDPDLPRLRRPPYFRFGDFLELSGRLQQPQPIEGFDYPAYLESKGIGAVLWADRAVLASGVPDNERWTSRAGAMVDSSRSLVYELRRKLFHSLDKSLPPEQAALAQALLLGVRGQLPEDVTDNFRRTGTSHLLAISGLHMGIFLLLSLGLFQGTLGRHTSIPLLLSLALVWLYVLLSGAPPSVIRAAIMGSVYLAALGLGRPRESLLPALALSAVVMTALDPGLASQISFQLSFAAMAGIALSLPWQEAAARIISARLHGGGRHWGAAAGALLGWVVSGMVISAAATCATLPLVLLYFHHLPLVSIPATLLATPLLPLSLVGSGVVAVLGTLHPGLGQVSGLLGAIPLSAMLLLVDWMPKWTIEFQLADTGFTWAWYGVLLAVLVLTDTRTYRARVLSKLSGLPVPSNATDGVALTGGRLAAGGSPVAVLASILLVLAAGYAVVQFFDGRDSLLHVHFLDVGQGDGILIESPGGRQALLDGGPEYAGATQAIGKILPPWDRSLELVMATHLDADHSRGLLKVLDNYRVGRVFVGNAEADSPLHPEWAGALGRAGHRAVNLVAGQTVYLEEDVTLRVLHPPAVPLRGPAWDSNNNSLVLQLAYGDISFLLTGDIEAEAERHLVRSRQALESNVLKAAHHGSNSSTTAEFLDAVRPRWAVISAGSENQYGHPHPDVIARLENVVGATAIFDTASRGTISFSTDGQSLWVTTERQPGDG